MKARFAIGVLLCAACADPEVIAIRMVPTAGLSPERDLTDIDLRVFDARDEVVVQTRGRDLMSDLAIVTSDNPRTEDPEAILRDVAEGLSGRHEVIVDRRQAIRRAIEQATPDDVVIIAGKGHEDYQILGREKVPFDDRVEARCALATRGARS